MSNPAFRSTPVFSNRTLTAAELRKLYNEPAATPQARADLGATTAQAAQAAHASGGVTAADVIGDAANPMTIENTISKTGILFGVLLVCAAVGWFFPALALPAALGGLVLAFVIAFKKSISVPLICAYAALEGVFVGGISQVFEAAYAGIVFQAILGTVIVFGVTLALFASGKIRASKKANKIALIAIIGYALFSLVNVGLMLTGVVTDPWGLRGVQIMGVPLGLVIGVFAIVLAAYMLVMDFDFIQQGARNRLPEKYGWYGAYGLLVTLVWLYIEILRLLAILRQR